MGNLITIVTSFFLGILIIFIFLRLNLNISEDTSENDVEFLVKSNLLNLSSIIENDIRKIGYRASSQPIVSADSNSIKFISDIDLNGSPDSIQYILGDASSASHSINPNDKILFRIVNTDTFKVSKGLTNFKLTYYDVNDVVTQNPMFIKSLELEIRVESEYPVKDYFPFSERKVLIKPRNLN